MARAGPQWSGRASAKADADWLKAPGLAEIDPHSVHAVTVPGAIDAWDRLLKQQGTMTLGSAEAGHQLAETGRADDTARRLGLGRKPKPCSPPMKAAPSII